VNIVHRDIKLENIYVTAEGDLKIGLLFPPFRRVSFHFRCSPGDLGLSVQLEGSLAAARSLAGTQFVPIPFSYLFFFVIMPDTPISPPEAILVPKCSRVNRLTLHPLLCVSLNLLTLLPSLS
jgi:serine/threonine protein kinase